MKPFIRKTFKAIYFLCAFAYLCACLTPYIHPKYFFGFTFLAIGFTALFILMLCWLIFYLFTNKKMTVVSFMILLIGFKNFSNNIGFTKTYKTYNQTIKVLSWNVCDFVNNYDKYKTVDQSLYLKFINETNADIVCLQDIGSAETKDSIRDIDNFIATSKYPYSFFSSDLDTIIANTHHHYGTLILSKFPIHNSFHINYNGRYFPESLAIADVNVKGKPIRIFNTHLRSMYIKMPKDKRPKDFKYVIEDTNLLFHSSAFTKILHYDTAHIAQAQLIRKVFDTTKIPFIFCADMNSTPSSYVYNTLRKNVNDAFLQNHFGWQETYRSKIPSMRIDAVLTSKELQPISYFSPRHKLSDHYPIITEIGLP